ncbi:MAG: hypothetical protein U0T68_13180 [Ferruginibacter sp.]
MNNHKNFMGTCSLIVAVMCLALSAETNDIIRAELLKALALVAAITALKNLQAEQPARNP